MARETAYFGIRHHGPGSARRLIEALDALDPALVLIEGPADVSELIPFLADDAMVLPVALLAYAADDPSSASFWPFAEFSPEYKAIRWALARGKPVRFIDLPVSWRLKPPPAEDASDAPPTDEIETPEISGAPEDAADPPLQDHSRDPIGALAHAAGYEDGESWWSDVIEQNPDPGPIFQAIADAMGALRTDAPPLAPFEAAREAHMRLEIARAEKETEGAIAVVCGAWHVPALKEKHSQKDDKALLKAPPKRKIAATWAPWTSQRLAFESGYGAGVAAPGWNLHLWRSPDADAPARWLTRIAECLRAEGHLVSTASVIEAQRLATALAALRHRPQPGFEEFREVATACFCHGEPLVWQTVARKLLIGSDVGSIPNGVPLAPLLDDLKRQQTRLKMKPEALERERSLDLRSDSGLDRSTLLHRLAVLKVNWGTLQDAGKSRGTFRERWVLSWKPEFAVELVENLVYGATIEQAAAGRLSADLAQTLALPDLAEQVHRALTAQLSDAAAFGLRRLADRAANSSDCTELLGALVPIADIIRYGQARETDTSAMQSLFVRLAIGGALALPYAARGLDAAAAQSLGSSVRAADRAFALLEASEDISVPWMRALHDVLASAHSTALIAGLSARLLYQANELSAEAAANELARRMSPGTPLIDAAGFFEGFFEGKADSLLHDEPLRNCVDVWIASLDEDDFVSLLPLFRRVFSALDRMQRRRLIASVLGETQTGVLEGLMLVPEAAEAWPAHAAMIVKILNGEGAP